MPFPNTCISLLFIGILFRMRLFPLALVGTRNCFLYVISLDLRMQYHFLHSAITLSKARRCPGQVWVVFAWGRLDYWAEKCAVPPGAGESSWVG